jgi:hypothetical protein
MIPVRWRARLVYTAMSAFIVLHTVTLVTTPMPDSALKETVLSFLHPYVAPLRLNNTWDFYAPGIGYGTWFRYTVEDGAGQSHTFTPAAGIGWLNPRYWWSSEWYKAVARWPEDYASVAGALLCREHADLHPVAVTLTQIEQKPFGVNDQMDGKHPLDPEFFDENTIERVECQH